jgi:uncharacterized protein (DUF488 family)
MLREAGLSEMVKKKIPKRRCVFVARKRGNDELAPSDEIFREFNSKKMALEKRFGKGSVEAHNQAYLSCDYENKFREQIMKNPEALKKLENISKRAQKEDVFLVCYEGLSKACHRRILLRIAEEQFGVKVSVQGVEP